MFPSVATLLLAVALLVPGNAQAAATTFVNAFVNDPAKSSVTVVEATCSMSTDSRGLRGCEVLFHTAACSREYFQPGDHRDALT